MSKEKVGFEALRAYLPEGSFDGVVHYISHYKIQLTITRERKTVLGNYQYLPHSQKHLITVNGNLNPYSFLITFLHEVAHLEAFLKHTKKIAAHGVEWKQTFSRILVEFLSKKIFPEDVETAIFRSLKSPAASSCSDEQLMRVLRNYDAHKHRTVLVEELKIGELFQIKGGRIFRKGEKRIKRHKCEEVATGKWYLFSGVYEVKPVN